MSDSLGEERIKRRGERGPAAGTDCSRRPGLDPVDGILSGESRAQKVSKFTVQLGLSQLRLYGRVYSH
jgi:hypothetical protein